MKKVMSLIIVFLLILMQIEAVNAVTEDTSGTASAEVTLTTPTKLEQNTKTFTSVIYIGNIQNLGNNDYDKVVAYSATLGYDANIIESVKVEGKNGWSASYTNGAIVANTDNISPNQEMIEITFTLKDKITANQINISLTNARISNSGTLTQDLSNITKTISIETQAETPNNENKNETTNNKVNETTKNEVANNETTNTNSKNNNTKNETKTTNSLNAISTNTTASARKVTSLPKAGLENTIIIAVIILAIIGIFSAIRSKSIKTK